VGTQRGLNRRGRRRVAVGLTTTLVLIGLSTAGAGARATGGHKRASGRGTRVSGQVYYDQRNCLGANEHRAVPLVGAAVVLDRPGQAVPVITYLDGHGRYSAKLHGSGRPSVDVILEDRNRLVSVIPQGDHDNSFRVPLSQKAGRNPRLVLTGQDAAAGNVFTVAMKAANYVRGQRIHVPLAIFEIHNLLDKNDISGAYYDPGRHTVHLNNWRDDPRVDNAWEPFTIVHEYGHHVMFTTARPPTNPGSADAHFADRVYPRVPGLAYSEGFAHALAALVLGKPDLGYDCKSFMHIGTVPATPLAQVTSQAQFNETAAGAVLWRLEKRYGLHNVVLALTEYKARAGHYPDDMREAREAVVNLEHGSPAEHLAIDQIFGQQNLRWGMLVTITHEGANDETKNGTDMFYEVQLTLHGPYGDCQVNARPGQFGADPGGDPRNPLTPARPALTAYQGHQWAWDSSAEGNLGYTWQDECLLNTADGMIDPQFGSFTQGAGSPYAGGSVGGPPSAQVLFPYLSGMAQHRQDFTLSARWLCVAPAVSDASAESGEPGPPDEEACHPGAFVLEYFNGLVKGLDDHVIANNYGPPGPDNTLHLANATNAVKVELVDNVDTPVMRWSANGTCTLLIDSGADCGIAEINR
jgi:hypothetical protein